MYLFTLNDAAMKAKTEKITVSTTDTTNTGAMSIASDAYNNKKCH